jgi:phosphoribosylformylglycinamidine synthase
MKTDCNGRYVYLEPRTGAAIAVAESARNVACSGARPLAITNNLNFGNPKRPEVYYQLREAIAGIGAACRALGTPVTGGNVSLYNESPSGAVYPTPVIGMLGLVDSLDHVTRSAFQRDGDAIVLFGEPADELGASEYLARIHGTVAGAPPRCDLAREQRTIDALLTAIRAGHVHSAHDCSDGGLAVALAECCMMDRGSMHGADVDLSPWDHLPARVVLFGETQARIIVSTAAPEAVLAIARRCGIEARALGFVRGRSHDLTWTLGGRTVRASLDRLASAYHDAIPRIMARPASAVGDPATDAVTLSAT